MYTFKKIIAGAGIALDLLFAAFGFSDVLVGEDVGVSLFFLFIGIVGIWLKADYIGLLTRKQKAEAGMAADEAETARMKQDSAYRRARKEDVKMAADIRRSIEVNDLNMDPEELGQMLQKDYAENIKAEKK